MASGCRTSTPTATHASSWQGATPHNMLVPREMQFLLLVVPEIAAYIYVTAIIALLRAYMQYPITYAKYPIMH